LLVANQRRVATAIARDVRADSLKAIPADPPKAFKRHRPVPIVRLQAKAAF
jgi:hypothetical protein